MTKHELWTEEQSAWLASKWRKTGDEADHRKEARAYFNCAQDIETFFKSTPGDQTLAAHDQKVGDQLAAWMIANSFATGHGDTVEDLLKELKWQIEERIQRNKNSP